MAVHRHEDDIIYLEHEETEQEKKRNLEMTEENKFACYCGYKFEYVCSNEPAGEPVDVNKYFCTVMYSKLNAHTICFGAEMDCYNTRPFKTSSSKNNYVELKTSKVIRSDKDQFSFERYKLLKFWAQSYLAGVGTVICGFRDEKGILRDVNSLNTFSIPDIVKFKRNMWNANVCLNFLDQILTWLKANTTKNVLYKLKFVTLGYIELVVEASILDDVISKTFLPKSFFEKKDNTKDITDDTIKE